MAVERANVPCGSCRLCCLHDVIMLFPDKGDDLATYEHEVVTLSGVGTGAILKTKPEGGCIYLGADGCTIHDRAPAICRVFDCRRFFQSHTRAERRRMVKTGMASKAVLDAGAERLWSLKERHNDFPNQGEHHA